MQRFGKDFLKILDYLILTARKTSQNQQLGERMGRGRGSSLEFADFRRYVPGDELRYVDWNVYARLGKLFVKEFSQEQSVNVALLVDTSNSMSYGNPAKMEYSLTLGAALGIVGLARLDRVQCFRFSGHCEPLGEPLRGQQRTAELLDELGSLEPSGPTNMAQAFRELAENLQGKWLLLVLSDFYDHEHYAEAFRVLRSPRFQTRAVHLIDPQELSPLRSSDQELVDLETGLHLPVEPGEATLRAYQEKFSRYLEDLEQFFRRSGIRYVKVLTSMSLPEVFLELLGRRGILERR